EVHATRYQYGFALTPDSLRDKTRALRVIEAILSLREVGGNHSRFLFDFSPASVVFRWTDDFAPRILYGFEMDAEGNVSFSEVLRRVSSGDIKPDELFIAGDIVDTLNDNQRSLLNGAELCSGIKSVAMKLSNRIAEDLGIAMAGV
ncbi:MAG: type I-B CRISPR-associated protein Cas7/Cst2/DevR, partial [Cyanobacteria bacterium]|nr:type I-B CRISPR-associated protein Cas7/Cst2/DevR [Cyanobacteriota bacterium]